MYYQISDVAAALEVHARTVVRIIGDDVGAAFTKATAEKTTLPILAKAFNSTVKVLSDVLNGKDKFITQTEASAILRIPERTLRHWRVTKAAEGDYRFGPDLEGGQTVRYSKKRITALRATLKSE